MQSLSEKLNVAGTNPKEKVELETRFRSREELLAGVYHQVGSCRSVLDLFFYL